MSGIVEQILSTKVSATEMECALQAIGALPPEDRKDIGARAVCLIRMLGENEVSARVAAIDWRFQALARLSTRPEFRNWSLPGRDGASKITIAVLEVAATEPLIELEDRPAFDADSFFKRLLGITEEEGHG
jgi:hypothetical protein